MNTFFHFLYEAFSLKIQFDHILYYMTTIYFVWYKTTQISWKAILVNQLCQIILSSTVAFNGTIQLLNCAFTSSSSMHLTNVAE